MKDKTNPDYEQKYWQQKTDNKKMALGYLRSWWIIVISAAAGMVLGVAVYFIYHAVTDPVRYEGYSEFYLDFAADETGEAYQYYNGYTWNDLMTTDLIAVNTLKGLEGTGADLERLEEDTSAEIKSDIRVLRVTFDDEDSEMCASIQAATEASLECLGDTAKEFKSITTIKSIKPARVYADDRLKQAILLGALIGLVLSAFAVWFKLILDDHIMTPSDLGAFGIPVLGIEIKSGRSKTADRLAEWTADNISFAEKKAMDEHQGDCIRVSICDIADGSKKPEEMTSHAGIIVNVPFRKITGKMTELIIADLGYRGVNIIGFVITEADEGFFRLYL